MSRRYAPGGLVYHVLNRINERARIFRKYSDYAFFHAVLLDALAKVPMRVIAYCLMPNHWHFVLWPKSDGDLAKFMHWLTMTHAKRWRRRSDSEGNGHVYRGRYKSFPVEEDEHYYSVCRYVERNGLTADLAPRAEEWPWSSLRVRCYGSLLERGVLAAGPLPLPRDWTQIVNRPETENEFRKLRESLVLGRPYGSPEWTKRIARELGLESTLWVPPHRDALTTP